MKKLKKYSYILLGLVIIYLIYKISSGIIWFIFQTALYGVLVMVLLMVLKKKGFFSG